MKGKKRMEKMVHHGAWPSLDDGLVVVRGWLLAEEEAPVGSLEDDRVLDLWRRR